MFKRLLKIFFKIVAAVALLVLITLTLLFALLSHEHHTPITLPSPTGHFPVGRTTYTWISSAQTDELSPTPDSKRTVMVWIWYPAAAGAAAPPAEYLPAPWRIAEAQHSGILLGKFLTRDIALVHTHSAADAPVSTAEPTYPVVILRAGGGAFTTDFTTLAEDLSSHGYIVVGFDAPYRTILFVYPDGHVAERAPSTDPENLNPDQANHLINQLLPMWTTDTKFVVDQLQQLNAADPSGRFTGHLDLHRLGMFGHSFGGAASLQFCHDDPRCKAALDMDGAPYGSVVQDGLQQPTMFLLSDHSGEMSDPASREIATNIHSIYDRLPNGRFFVTLRGAHHFSFSDQSLLKSHYLMKVLSTVGPFGKLDSRRGLAITAAYVYTFFDVYLNGAPPAELTSLSTQYPEVHREAP